MLLYFAELKLSFRDVFSQIDGQPVVQLHWQPLFTCLLFIYVYMCVCVGGVFKSIRCHLVIPIVDCCVGAYVCLGA